MELSDLNSSIFFVVEYGCHIFALDLNLIINDCRMKNFAKKFLVALFVLLPCFQTTTVWAGNPEDIPVIPNPNNAGSGGVPKHRARARYIEVEPQCYYYEGEVTIQADPTVSYISAQVVRAEDNMTWSDAGVGSTITLTVTSDPGTYYLYFTLSNGKSYMGKYILY